MKREIVAAKDAPEALGPYSQAVRAAGETLVFTSGQVAIDPATGRLVAGGIVEKTRQALKNLAVVLGAAGASLETVVKTTVFMADLSEFAEMNAVYAEHFPAAPPARATVQAARLPLDARIEVEAVALVAAGG